VPARYGREALYTDQLAYQLYTNTLKTPVQGASFGINDQGENITWQPVKTDSLHRFRPTRIFGVQGGFTGRGSAGYLYLTYSSPTEKIALLISNVTAEFISMANYIWVMLIVRAGCIYL